MCVWFADCVCVVVVLCLWLGQDFFLGSRLLVEIVVCVYVYYL
jgi:hypothetical protein